MFKLRLNLLVLSLFANFVFGVDTNWNNNAGDNLWQTAGNWSAGLPSIADNPAVIRGGSGYCWINSATEAYCNTLRIGVLNNPSSKLVMTGGLLSVAGDVWIGRWSGSTGSIWQMDGGAATVGGSLRVSFNSNNCRLDINGGQITVAGGLSIDESNGTGGRVNITGGKLALTGDHRHNVQAYIDAGKITGYDGLGEVAAVFDSFDTIVTAAIFFEAHTPSPIDNASGISASVTLSWAAGATAVSHNLYIGTSYDSVLNATTASNEFIGNQSVAQYTAELEKGIFYYWRVDEVDEFANVISGDVWTFKTAACDEPITAMTWNNSSGDNLWRTSNNWGGGFVPNVCCDVAIINGGTGQCVIDGITNAKAGKIRIGVSGNPSSELKVSGGILDVAGDIVVGVWPGCENSQVVLESGLINVDGNLHLGLRNPQCRLIVQDGEFYLMGFLNSYDLSVIDIYDGTFILEGNRIPQIKTLEIDGKIKAFSGLGVLKYEYTNGKTVVTARYSANIAKSPIPANRALSVNMTPTLSWQRSSAASYHHIYFGVEKDAVENATTFSEEYKGVNTISNTSFNTGVLEGATTYFWRIDESNGYDIWKGDVWSFTTRRVYGISYWMAFFDYWLSGDCSIGNWYCYGWDINKSGVVDLCDFGKTTGLSEQNVNEYYVAPYGNDTNAGTLQKPFKTIQRAAEIMVSGNVCYIRQGIYREIIRPLNSGTSQNPIRFEAYEQEEVIVSGLEPIESDWVQYNGGIYKTQTSLPVNQVFVDGVMINEARWPNCPVEGLLNMPRAAANEGTNTEMLFDSELPTGNWDGAYAHITVGKEYVSYTRKIKSYSSGESFEFETTGWATENQEPVPGNPYYLFGSLLALDTAGEWYFDSDINLLFIYCPGDVVPDSHLIEYKCRDYAFDLSLRDFVQLKGINIIGAAINLDKSNYCKVMDCHIKYPEHFRFTNGYDVPDGSRKNIIGGSFNEWKDSSIVYSAGCGLWDRGSFNKVTNCIIRDVNYMASSMAAINSSSVEGGEYSYNTLYNSGRSIILHGSTPNLRIMHNDMFNAGLLTKDCGITYTWSSTGNGTVIAYNHLHDNMTELGMGVYLDYGCSGFNVHHNLIWNINWSAIHINFNQPALFNEIHNNTIMSSCKYAFRGSGESYDQSGSRFFNNCIDITEPRAQMYFVSDGILKLCPPYPSGIGAPVVNYTGYYPIVTDVEADNFGELRPGSEAIDGGAVIPGVTDGYYGNAPDIGCFEAGTVRWSVGADWNVE